MYFCKNCGEPYMTDEAVMCVKCGVAKGQGNNYCHNCGKPLAPDAAVCLNCGVANAKNKSGEKYRSATDQFRSTRFWASNTILPVWALANTLPRYI